MQKKKIPKTHGCASKRRTWNHTKELARVYFCLAFQNRVYRQSLKKFPFTYQPLSDAEILLKAICSRLMIHLSTSNLPVLLLLSIKRILSAIIKLSSEVCVHNSALTTINRCTFRTQCCNSDQNVFPCRLCVKSPRKFRSRDMSSSSTFSRAHLCSTISKASHSLWNTAIKADLSLIFDVFKHPQWVKWEVNMTFRRNGKS